jgi:hypothetical protein
MKPGFYPSDIAPPSLGHPATPLFACLSAAPRFIAPGGFLHPGAFTMPAIWPVIFQRVLPIQTKTSGTFLISVRNDRAASTAICFNSFVRT